MEFWLICIGLGMSWHGAMIIWAGGLPRALRRGEVPTAAKGTPKAFGLFWLDQYSYIGLTLSALGLVIALYGWLA